MISAQLQANYQRSNLHIRMWCVADPEQSLIAASYVNIHCRTAVFARPTTTIDSARYHVSNRMIIAPVKKSMMSHKSN
jgi:hypothetical protein